MKTPRGAPQVSKLQARVALWAGIFIVVLVSGTWFFVAKAVADNYIASNNADDARFLGQVFTTFALFIIAGFLGIANGIAQLRSGRRSLVLTIAMYVVFLAGLVTLAVNGHHS